MDQELFYNWVSNQGPRISLQLVFKPILKHVQLPVGHSGPDPGGGVVGVATPPFALTS